MMEDLSQFFQGDQSGTDSSGGTNSSPGSGGQGGKPQLNEPLSADDRERLLLSMQGHEKS
jgi:hypothetical protein